MPLQSVKMKGERRLRKCSSHKYKTTVIRGGQENRLFIGM